MLRKPAQASRFFFGQRGRVFRYGIAEPEVLEKSVHLKQQVIYGVGTYEASNPDETAKTDVDAKARGRYGGRLSTTAT